MMKKTYVSPDFRSVDLKPFWDVCSDASLPSSGTEPFNPTPGGGWEDDFNN